jgi:hypothetical protein
MEKSLAALAKASSASTAVCDLAEVQAVSDIQAQANIPDNICFIDANIIPSCTRSFLINKEQREEGRERLERKKEQKDWKEAARKRARKKKETEMKNKKGKGCKNTPCLITKTK